MRFLALLRQALALLCRHPLLFLPNYAMGFLSGLLKLAATSLLLAMTAPLLEGAAAGEPAPPLPASVWPAFFAVTGFSLLLVPVALVVSAMYPFLVADLRSGRALSLRASFFSAIARLPTLLAATLALLAFLVPLAFALLLAYFLAAAYWPLWLQLAAAAALLFALLFALYLFFPVASLEKRGALSTLTRSASLAAARPLAVGQASLFTALLSLASYAFGFLQKDPAALALFWGTQFLIATLATYLYTLNPLVYFEVAEA